MPLQKTREPRIGSLPQSPGQILKVPVWVTASIVAESLDLHDEPGDGLCFRLRPLMEELNRRIQRDAEASKKFAEVLDADKEIAPHSYPVR